MILDAKILVASALLAGYYSTAWALPLSSHAGVERPTVDRGDTIGGKVDPLSLGLERRNNPRPVNTHKEKWAGFVNVKAIIRKQDSPKGVQKLATTPNRAKAPPSASPPSHIPVNRKPSAKKSPAKRPPPQTPKGKPHQLNGKLPKKAIQVAWEPAPSMKGAKGCLERRDCTITQMLQLLQNPVKPPQVPQRQLGNKSPIYAMNFGAMKFQESVQGDEGYEDEQ